MIGAFDELIAQTRALVEPTALFDMYEGEGRDGRALPMSVGAHANKGIILRADTAVELGGGTEGSCAFVISTNDVGLLHDGRVSLQGPDIPFLPVGEASPFAQVILVAGSELTPEDHRALEECQYVKDYIDGYLVRSTSGRLWSRVSHSLHGKGFDFGMLACALDGLVRGTCPRVERTEFLFVTSSKADVEALGALRDPWMQASHELKKELWLERGVDIDCPAGGHCGRCADKELCDRVRSIARERKRESADA